MEKSLTISSKDIELAPVTIDMIPNSIMFDRSTEVRLDPLYFPQIKPQKNCRNCGAPLNRNSDCEYCGTKYQTDNRILVDPPKIGKSELVVTANEIRVSVG